jgi:hypothetical protein
MSTRSERPFCGMRRHLGSVVLMGLARFGSSCNLDPVHSKMVDELGPENAQAYPPESAYHRPGEPCGLCHSDKGPAKSTFVLAGTVFWGPINLANRADNVYVRILDGKRRKLCFVTNCNGNFFVREGELAQLTFPLLVSVERTIEPGKNEATLAIRRMSSHIGREGSCGACHSTRYHDFASPGPIHLFNAEQEFEEKKIPLAKCPPPPEQVQVAMCPEEREL